MESNTSLSLRSIPAKPESMPEEPNEMSGIKRSRDGVAKEKEKAGETVSRFMPMFEVFRNELDEHHDRRERIIKASRDITAASKKMYTFPSSSKFNRTS